MTIVDYCYLTFIVAVTGFDPQHRMRDDGARYQLVFTTCPDLAAAERIGQALVAERLAACVNVLPRMRSVYRWKGQIETASEHLLIVKIRKNDYEAVERRIRALHPYELPEVIAVPVVGGSAAYLAWLDDPDTVP